MTSWPSNSNTKGTRFCICSERARCERTHAPNSVYALPPGGLVLASAGGVLVFSLGAAGVIGAAALAAFALGALRCQPLFSAHRRGLLEHCSAEADASCAGRPISKDSAAGTAHALAVLQRREQLHAELAQLRAQPRTKAGDARKRELKQLLWGSRDLPDIRPAGAPSASDSGKAKVA